MLKIQPQALEELAVRAFHDVSHLLRPAHLKQLRTILDDPEASDNDKFVAYDFLKNANIAAGVTIDADVVIGDNCTISPTGKPENFDSPTGNYFIRDGIVIVPKNGIIPHGTVI